MRKLFYISFMFSLCLYAQNTRPEKITGEVSYQSSSNIYFKFDDTGKISESDTVFSLTGRIRPVAVIRYKSSLSASGEKIKGTEIKNGDKVFLVTSTKDQPEKGLLLTKRSGKLKPNQNFSGPLPEINSGFQQDYFKLRGKTAVSSYTYFSNLPNDKGTQRWRYNFSLSSDRQNSSPVFFDSYMNFSYRTKEWAYLKKALKVYSLYAGYEITKGLQATFGRRINPKLSNMGAVDGLQVEKDWMHFSAGVIAGSRPSFDDYGINTNLAQAGVYISRRDSLEGNIFESTLSLVQQNNSSKVDRRYLYFQNNNYLLSNLFTFVSTEIDLYKKVNHKGQFAFRLTSLFASVNYRTGKLSARVSYDARNNVIYYETYKTYADSLLEAELRQGVRAGVNYRLNRFTIGIDGGYRNLGSDISPSKNWGIFGAVSIIPYIKASANLRYTKLETGYLNGDVVNLSVYKNLSEYLYSSFTYRTVNYKYIRNSYIFRQNIISPELQVSLMKNFTFSLNYEFAFSKKDSYNSFYLSLIKRWK